MIDDPAIMVAEPATNHGEQQQPTTNPAEGGGAAPPGFEPLPRRLHGGVPLYVRSGAAAAAGPATTVGGAAANPRTPTRGEQRRRCSCGHPRQLGCPYCARCGGAHTPLPEGPAPAMPFANFPLPMGASPSQVRVSTTPVAETAPAAATAGGGGAPAEWTLAQTLVEEAPTRRRRHAEIAVD